MEFEKKTDKFSFGAGTVKAAGIGNVADAEPVQKSATDKNKVAKTVAIAAVSATVFLIKRKIKRK